MSTLPNTFGPALRALRQTLGLSQLALAHRLRSTQRHISFLETGRSRATAGFLQRLCTELNLSTAQRGALFEASELRNPYPARSADDAEIGRALDLIEHRVLRNWPFPAFALDRDWTVLRANTGARAMLAGFGDRLDDTRPLHGLQKLDLLFQGLVALGSHWNLFHFSRRSFLFSSARHEPAGHSFRNR